LLFLPFFEGMSHFIGTLNDALASGGEIVSVEKHTFNDRYTLRVKVGDKHKTYPNVSARSLELIRSGKPMDTSPYTVPGRKAGKLR
jgi:hypothetical protein